MTTSTGETVAHAPTGACLDQHCHSCNVDEPSRRGDYLACGGCGHVYRTEGGLRHEYRRAVAQIFGWFSTKHLVSAFRDPGKILSCPLCGHDL
jgi:uncharacterized C2H2 Zn-finger protein